MEDNYDLYKITSPDSIFPILVVARTCDEAEIYARCYLGFIEPRAEEADISLLDKIEDKVIIEKAKGRLGIPQKRDGLDRYLYVGILPRAA